VGTLLVGKCPTSPFLFASHASLAFSFQIIIAFGRRIYDLQGPASESTFIKTWCIGIGFGQIQEWTYVVRTALEAVLVLSVADLLWLAQDASWFENHMDWLSIYWSTTRFASRKGGTSASYFQKAFHYTKALV
jgi:hypothetical protein